MSPESAWRLPRSWRRFSVGLALAMLWYGALPAPSAAQLKTNFASSITSESMTPMWVARERGLFKKHGLDMQYVVIPRSPLAIAALAAGEIDAAIVGPGHLINSASTGSDLIGIANFFQKLDYRLVARPEIKKVEDMRGKRVAISGPGATSHLVTMLAFQGMNLDPAQAKITLLTIPGTELNRRLAMESGAIEATSLRGAIGELYGNKGYSVLYNLKAMNVNLPQSVLVTSRRTAAAKPQVIDAYLRAMIEAIAITVDPASKSGVTRAIMSNLRLSNPADAEEAYNAVVSSIERVPYMHLDSMKRLHQLLVQVNPKVADVRIEGVIENSFINKLESSGYIQSVYKKN
ncbi:MAG TPA: ABC transporter substrate-binding protein [Candidatus Binatia bacterium]|nr:ABC transporter substrate-binding protein [Candidatus Binatia bacterium]